MSKTKQKASELDEFIGPPDPYQVYQVLKRIGPATVFPYNFSKEKIVELPTVFGATPKQNTSGRGGISVYHVSGTG